MDMEQRIESEGRTLKEAVERACQMLGVHQGGMEYKLCAEHFRGGADTVRIRAWRRDNRGREFVDLGETLLGGILRRMGLAGSVHIRDDGQSLRASLELDDPNTVIGRGGQVLDALQHVVNKALAKQGSEKRLILDVENFREKHEQNLKYVAQKVCERVMRDGCVVTLKPMNAYDRRLVHLEVARYPGLRSRSGGEGQMKRIQVFLLPGEES